MSISFEDNNVKISYLGIDFIRSGFCYKHIDFSEIKYVKFKKGHDIKYWWISGFLGLILALFSLISIFNMSPNLNLNAPAIRIHLFIYISLYILLIIGTYLIIRSFKKKEILEIVLFNHKKYLIPRDKEYMSLIDLFKSQDVRFIIE